MVVSIGNIIDKFMTMPLSFRKKHMDDIRMIYQAETYEEKCQLAIPLLNKIMEKESGLVDAAMRG